MSMGLPLRPATTSPRSSTKSCNPTYTMAMMSTISTVSRDLLPGMYGKMKLTMSQPQSALFVPSSAIVRDGGMTYLFKNENGIARRKSILIQMESGTTAAVRWSVNGTTQELSPDEEIVTSNQGELQDGTVIQATLAN